jgi:uncharacterized paraquat-inducible protein A
MAKRMSSKVYCDECKEYVYVKVVILNGIKKAFCVICKHEVFVEWDRKRSD